MKVSGRMKHVAMGAGVWQLVADDGRKFQIAGGDAGLRVDDMAVTVEGDIDKTRMSFGMTAPTFVVTGYEIAGRATSY